MATSDAFGRVPLTYGGGFAADSACISLGLTCEDEEGDPIEIPGLLTQQLGIQYQQPITRLYEVGSQRTYFVAGRPQGTSNIARVLGPGSLMAEFYSCLGNVCNAVNNDMCFCLEAGCFGQEEGQQDCHGDEIAPFGAMNICLKNVVMQNLGFTVQAQDMLINEQLALFFTALIVEEAEDGCQCQEACEVTCDCFTA